MKANRGMVDLEQKITLLKNKQEYDLEILKTHFHYSYESLKPVNIIKNIVQDIVSSSEIKTGFFKGATKFFFNKFFH